MKMHRYTLEEAQAMARRDKRRMIAFTVGVALIGGVYFMAPYFSGQSAQPAGVPLLAQRVPEVAIEPLPFEETAALALIDDATEPARLTLESQALVPAFAYARKQSAQLFDALGIGPLDEAARAELVAAPAQHRLRALSARGEVVDVERRRREGGARDDWLVTLRDADGSFAHALFATPPRVSSTGRAAEPEDEDAVVDGDQLRVDGLFFKFYRREIGGAWVDAPLLLTHHAIAALPAIDELTARSAPALERVVDDEVGALQEQDEEALWQLMARAKTLAGEVDWEHAPEVDSATLAHVFEDGATFRGTPFRFPISRNMGSWAETAPENPLGLQRVTRGWIGNVTWRNPVSVVQWIAPIDSPELAEWDNPKAAQFIEARGWFFRNVVYTRESGEPGRAPFFVLASVDPFVPPPDKVTTAILWFVFGLTAVVMLTIFGLLRADRKKSNELQESLVKRRRARRERAGLQSASTS